MINYLISSVSDSFTYGINDGELFRTIIRMYALFDMDLSMLLDGVHQDQQQAQYLVTIFMSNT